MTVIRKPLPLVGQLKTGEYVVFNMETTPLWDKTFPTRQEAVAALCLYSMGRRIVEGTL